MDLSNLLIHSLMLSNLGLKLAVLAIPMQLGKGVSILSGCYETKIPLGYQPCKAEGGEGVGVAIVSI